MASLLTCLVCFCALLGISSSNYQSMFKDVYNNKKSEKELRQHLFQNYDKLVRPVKNADEQMSVSVSLTPLYLRDLDEKNHVVVLESWMMMKWTDDYMKWDPSRFGNITVLRIPSTEVWRPDFAIYGSPEQSSMFPVPSTNALLYNNGMVLWVPMFTIHSRCTVPKPSKKIVTCNIQVGSWTFDATTVDIQLAVEQVDLSNFRDVNPNWKLMDISSERVPKYYPCCKEAYPVLNFNVTLKRRNELGMTTNGILTEEDTPIILKK